MMNRLIAQVYRWMQQFCCFTYKLFILIFVLRITWAAQFIQFQASSIYVWFKASPISLLLHYCLIKTYKESESLKSSLLWYLLPLTPLAGTNVFIWWPWRCFGIVISGSERWVEDQYAVRRAHCYSDGLVDSTLCLSLLRRGNDPPGAIQVQTLYCSSVLLHSCVGC